MYLDCQNIKIVSWISNSNIANVLEYIYEKAHLRSDFWQSIWSKYILQKYYFDGGQKFMHVSYNEWSLHTSIFEIVYHLNLDLTFLNSYSFEQNSNQKIIWLNQTFKQNMYSIDCASLCSTSEVMLLTTKYIRDDWILHVRLNELDWMDWFLLCFVMCHVSMYF